MRARRSVCAFLLLALFMGQTAAAETFSNDPAAIQEAAQSVMLLELYCDDECIGTASGFVAFDNKTLITNYHVIKGVTGILAYSDDDSLYYVDRVYAADKDKDLAILGFFSPTNLVPLRLGADAELLRAAPVLTISSPKGIKNSVSKGNISALFEAEGVSYIQISAPISPGSSGGALFDDQGLVIGVLEGALIDAQNMNLAIHIQNAMDLYHTVDAAKFVSLKEFADSIASAPSPTATPTPRPTPQGESAKEYAEALSRYSLLKIGDSGIAVQEMQSALIALGYLEDGADGIYGKNTEKAVRGFQREHALVADGVANPQTQKKIFDEYGKQYDEPEIPLVIPSKAYGEWRDDGNKLAFHLQVKNVSKLKGISAFELYIYPADVWGERLLEENYVYMVTTEAAIAPGKIAYSDFVSMDDADAIDRVYAAIHKIKMSNGSVIEIPEDEMVYSYWTID